jgi:methionyl-tRNA formyltransferase
LPHYRGSTTNYYSLIKENFLGASSLFLTSNIDEGHILIREKFLPPQDRNDIDHNYDSKIRSIVLIKTLKKYIELSSWDFGVEDNEKGEYYYIIHPVLKHLAIIDTKSFS